jgi:hypothetical protein
MRQFGHHIASLAFAAGVALHASGEVRAQDICGLGERVGEMLATIDACAATDSQLTELESVRQEILEPNDDTECEEIEERIAQLELTIPRLSDRGPSTLEQPVPMCEANQEAPPAAAPPRLGCHSGKHAKPICLRANADLCCCGTILSAAAFS